MQLKLHDISYFALHTRYKAAALNVKHLGNEIPLYSALSSLAGQYNEVAFKALDKMIDDPSKSGIKLILSFTDNWHLQDGLFQYVEWGGSTATGDFFTDPKIIQLFKDHITAVVNRTNTLNGRQYKNEPAIFAWDLINELRDGCNTTQPNATCDPSFTGSVQVSPPQSQLGLLNRISTFQHQTGSAGRSLRFVLCWCTVKVQQAVLLKLYVVYISA